MTVSLEKEKRTQVIITTHSADLLDYFSDRYDDVICFESDTGGKERIFMRTLDKHIDIIPGIIDGKSRAWETLQRS